jgi:methylmalonyl-CoA/ethylmalonyl-CoA epimerase
LSPAPFATNFHHVGFVVGSIDASLEGFMASIGAAGHTEIVEDPVQRVKVVFLLPAMTGQPQVELVEPVGEKSPVLRFLQQGGGLHHICYEVPDIDRQVAHMQGAGAALVRRPRPAVALGNRQIAWLMTRENLLIEYLETASGAAVETH